MSKEQPEAIRLAELIDDYEPIDFDGHLAQAADELRRLHAENEELRAQIGQGVPDGWLLVPKEPTDEMVRAALHLDLSYMPGHDGPDRAAVYKAMLASAPQAPQAERTALEQYDLEQSPDYRKGWDDGRKKGYEVGVRHGKEQHLFWQASVMQQKPLTDEQDRALCEAYCNAASDEYFKARPQLDSSANRRIFYAGHRKAWIDWQAAHNIGEKK